LSSESPRDDQPEGVFAKGVRLMPHQLTLLRKCREMEARSHVYASRDVTVSSRLGLMGDKSGAGKSLVIMALCFASPSPAERKDVTVSAMGDVVMCSRREPHSPPRHHHPRHTVKTNVVIVPHGLVRQWEADLGAFTPGMRWRVFSKTQHFREFMKEVAERADLLAAEGGNARVSDVATAAVTELLNDLDVAVVTPCQWEKYVAWLLNDHGVSVTRLVVDEADTCGLAAACADVVRYDFCWFVTASVHDVILDAVSDAGVVSRFTQKVWRSVVAGASSTTSGCALRVIRTMVAKNADDYVDAGLNLIPPVSSVLCCDDLASNAEKKKNKKRKVGEERGLSPRRITCDAAMKLLEGDFVDVESVRDRVTDGLVSCCVCLDPPPATNKVVMRCCAQVFCLSCISRWITTAASPPCPVCKTPIRRSRDTVLLLGEEEGKEGPRGRRPVSALENLLLLLRGQDVPRTRKPKVIVFVKDAASERDVARTVARCDLCSDTLRGTGDRIARVVDRYVHQDVDVLLLAPGSHGAGLNLGVTTDVVVPLSEEECPPTVRRRMLGSVLRLGGGRPSSSPLRVWNITARASPSPSDD